MFGFGGKLAQGVLNAQALGNQRGKVFDKGVIAVQELVNRVISTPWLPNLRRAYARQSPVTLRLSSVQDPPV